MQKTLLNIIKALIFILLIGIIFTYFIGFRYMFVLTGSMKPTFDVNALIVTKPMSFEALKKGDIITIKVDGNEKVKLTHRIVRIDNTSKLIYTKGDNNQSQDSNPTKYQNVVGKVIIYLPYVGSVFLFFKTTTGLIILGGVLLLVIITDNVGGKRKRNA